MDTKGGKPQGGGYGGVMNRAIGIDMYTLMCVKLMTIKNLLYKSINKIQKKKEIFRVNNNIDKFSKYLEPIKRQISISPLQTFKVGRVDEGILILKTWTSKELACSPHARQKRSMPLRHTDTHLEQAKWLGVLNIIGYF